LFHCRMWCYAIGVEAVVLRSWCVVLCTVCQLVWDKVIVKLFASSWYIFLTYIYDARSHLYQKPWSNSLKRVNCCTRSKVYNTQFYTSLLRKSFSFVGVYFGKTAFVWERWFAAFYCCLNSRVFFLLPPRTATLSPRRKLLRLLSTSVIFKRSPVHTLSTPSLFNELTEEVRQVPQRSHVKQIGFYLCNFSSLPVKVFLCTDDYKDLKCKSMGSRRSLWHFPSLSPKTVHHDRMKNKITAQGHLLNLVKVCQSSSKWWIQ